MDKVELDTIELKMVGEATVEELLDIVVHRCAVTAIYAYEPIVGGEIGVRHHRYLFGDPTIVLGMLEWMKDRELHGIHEKREKRDNDE